MISFFSFITAVLWLNITLFVIFLLRRSSVFRVKYSIEALLLVAALGVIRICLPLDFAFAKIFNSHTVLPAMRRVFQIDIMPGADSISLGTFILMVWIAGSLAVLSKAAREMQEKTKLRKQYSKVHNARIYSVAKGLGINKNSIVISGDVSSPYVIGVIRPHIYLPDIKLSNNAWNLVLRHEIQHFKSHDTLIKLFHLILVSVFWWSPFVHIFRRELDQLLELRCDANVTKHMCGGEKREYILSILAVLKQINKPEEVASPESASALVSLGAFGFTHERFRAVLDEDKPRPSKRLVLLVPIFLFMLSFMFIIQPTGQPTGDIMDVGVAITSENAYILVLADGTMEMYVDGEFFCPITEELVNDEFHLSLPVYEERRGN